MKILRNTPILWALTGLLAACGNNSGPTPGANQLPEVSVKLADGSSVSNTAYFSASEKLVFSASDADGTVTKIKWVIDAGRVGERSGEYTGADVKGKLDFALPNLSSGGHTLNLAVTDNVGGTGSAVFSFKVDAEAPVLSAVTLNARAVTDGQALTFTAGDAATLTVGATDSRGGGDTSASAAAVLVFVGDTLVKSGTAPLSLDIAALLGATTNVNSLRVVAGDSVGNTSTVRSFTVQFAAATGTGGPSTGGTGSVISPALPVANAANTVPAVVASGTAVSRPQFIRGLGSVSGTATTTANATLTSAQLLVDGQTSGTPNPSTGTVDLNFDFGTLNDGLHDASLRWKDSAGSVTESAKLSLYVDKTAPTVSWNRPANNAAISGLITLDTAIADSGVGFDLSGIQYFLDGNTTALADADTAQAGFQFESSGIVPGNHTLTAVATDRLGNRSQQSVTVITTTVPKVSISNAVALQDGTADNGAADGQVSGSISVKVDASDQSGIKQVELFANDLKLATLTSAPYTFALDTTAYQNGAVVIFARATNSTGQTADTAKVSIRTTNKVAPLLTISNPSNGQLVTTPDLPVQITISKRNSSFDIQNVDNSVASPNELTVDLLDYRGQKVDTKTFSIDANNTNVQDNVDGVYVTVPFDLSRYPADVYTLRATASVKLDGANQSIPISNSIQITTRNQSSNPPAAVIRTPVQLDNVVIRNADGTIHKPLPTDRLPILNRDSAFIVNASDDTKLKYVQVRVVSEDGTPTNAYFLNQLLDIAGPIDLLVPTVDIDGSQFVADNTKNGSGQYLNAYLLRITTEDSDSNRNIQEVWVRVDRGQRQTYSSGAAAFIDHKSSVTGQLTHQGAVWGFNCASRTFEDPKNLDSVEQLIGCAPLNNDSRIVAVSYRDGAIIGTDVFPQVMGGTPFELGVGFSTPGTYFVDFIVEDLSTGIVQRFRGEQKAVTKN